MPRVTFVKSARKDNPVAKKGESYYWWKHRNGPKRFSKTRPRPSQLTQSAYYSQVRSLVEMIEDRTVTDGDELIELKDEVASTLDELRDECQSSLDNMPDSLQYSPTGELLQERIDACEMAQSEVENIDDWDEPEPLEHEFEEACPECDGSGEIEFRPPDVGLYDESELTESCDNCDGGGEILNEEEYNQAQSDWEDRRQTHLEEEVSNMIDYVQDCEV